MIGLGLTKQQLAARNFIAEYIGQHGQSPSYTEIAAALRIGSKSGVTRIVNGLEERGHIRRMGRRARSIVVLDPQSATASVPLKDAVDAILRRLPKDVARKFQTQCALKGDTEEEVIRDLIVLYVDEVDARAKKSKQ